MKVKIWRLVSLSILLAVWFCGCGNENYEESKDDFVVGVAIKSSTSEFWMSVCSGMEAAAEEYGMTVIITSPDSELDEEVQEKQIEKLIEQSVDALAIAPINSENTPDYLNEIEDKGIYAVSFDTGFDKADLPYIGIDNYEVGYKLAEELANQLNHQGKVGIIAGDLKQKAHRERAEGFEDYISSEPEMQVEFVESGYANLQMSEKKVRVLMEQYPDVKGIMATSAVTAMGLVDELYDTDVKIVSVDVQEDSLEAVEQGRITALAAQSGYQIGYETISYIQRMRDGESLEKNYELEAEILTLDNIEQYRRQYEEQ